MLLVTGCNGYIGKRYITALCERGLPSEDILLVASKAIPGFKVEIYDPGKRLSVDLAEYEIDTVVHLGAATPKGLGEECVTDYIENVNSTIRLIHSLPNNPKRFIFVSTVSVYGSQDGKRCEDDIPAPNSSYGLSKLLCERYLEEWAGQEGVELCTLRLGSVYGPGEDSYRKITGTFLDQAMQGQALTIFSDGREVRNMVYIDDVVDMLCAATLSDQRMGIVNLVSKDEISVMDIALLAKKLTGSSAEIRVLKRQEGRNDLFDSAKMERVFGRDMTGTTYEEGMKQLLKYKVNHG